VVSDRSELLIFITPRVVAGQVAGRDVSLPR
jgi:type II secretory pathway component GspD/PulD (secretin)